MWNQNFQIIMKNHKVSGTLENYVFEMAYKSKLYHIYRDHCQLMRQTLDHDTMESNNDSN